MPRYRYLRLFQVENHQEEGPGSATHKKTKRKIEECLSNTRHQTETRRHSVCVAFSTYSDCVGKIVPTLALTARSGRNVSGAFRFKIVLQAKEMIRGLRHAHKSLRGNRHIHEKSCSVLDGRSFRLGEPRMRARHACYHSEANAFAFPPLCVILLIGVTR